MNARVNLGTLQNPQDVQRLTQHLQELYRNVNLVTTGTSNPTFIPQRIGDEYINTSTKKIFKATGTSHVSDWVQVN